MTELSESAKKAAEEIVDKAFPGEDVDDPHVKEVIMDIAEIIERHCRVAKKDAVIKDVMAYWNGVGKLKTLVKAVGEVVKP